MRVFFKVKAMGDKSVNLAFFSFPEAKLFSETECGSDE
jgi:hypothetical protein